MTEESYQQCRKTMKVANQLRMKMTVSKRDIEVWGAAEIFYKKEGRVLHEKAAKLKKDKSIQFLQSQTEKFESLKFPK